MTSTNADTIEVFRADDGWRWHAKAGNGEIVAEGEQHTRMGDAIRAAAAVFPDTPIVQLDDDTE